MTGTPRKDFGFPVGAEAFALRQTRCGTEIEQVARRLGIDVEAMGKYTRVLTAPADVV